MTREAQNSRMREGVDHVADVVVLGAGVTGLTIAQELAERNFYVTVIDPSYRGEPSWEAHRENPGLGGVARSQWGFIHNSATARNRAQSPEDPDHIEPTVPFPEGADPMLVPYSVNGQEVVLKKPIDGFIPSRHRGELREALVPFLRALGASCEFAFQASYLNPDDPPRVLAALKQALREALDSQEFDKKTSLQSSIEGLIIQDVDEGDPQPKGTVRIDLNLYALPGEHGFRFFPSFYRHIFDQMKRIPATSPLPGRVRRGRDTVYQNLVAVDRVGYVGRNPGPSAMIARRSIRSMEEVRLLLESMWRETEYTGADLMRLALKIWKYMTSSRQRREKDYENVSWFEFVEAESLSARGEFMMETTPGTLGGLLGSDSDARTQGTVLLQCMQDQFSDGQRSDMLLNGPTDQAWFAHWYRYLVSQGVKFKTGEITGFEYNQESGQIEPMIMSGDPEPEEMRFSPSPLPSVPRRGQPDKLGKKVYYILALPLVEACKQAEAFCAVYDKHKSALKAERPADFLQLKAFVRGGSAALDEALRDPYPKGPLRHIAGIQYFFNQDVRLFSAHTQYLDIASGLTAVAQPQFWLDPRNTLSGFRSLLSVDIGIWAPPTRDGEAIDGVDPNGWYPWGKSRTDIAVHLWQEIAAAHRGDFPAREYPRQLGLKQSWPRLPRPMYYHLDEYLQFDGEKNVLSMNKAPFLVCEKGEFRRRPGGHPACAPDWKVTIDYDVAVGQYILAGTYMQTYTRINSMEAACESGRHAVNALLRHLDVAGEPCQIWDPEDHESADLNDFKTLDDQLRTRNMPHMDEISGSDELNAWVWPSGGWSRITETARRRDR